jgi:thiazole synthase
MNMTASPDLATSLDTKFEIADREFRSRLLVGTGKYSSNAQMIAAIEASGAEVVTVAVRRVDLDRTKDEGILYHLDPQRFMLCAARPRGRIQ